ncbi:MAG: hypothetical protein GEU71_03550 [Actinobacteria bacterium]|nr:hypothetical protein [Actinomycetota bacterium]
MTDNQMLTTEQVHEIREHARNATKPSKGQVAGQSITLLGIAMSNVPALCTTVELLRQELDELKALIRELQAE